MFENEVNADCWTVNILEPFKPAALVAIVN